jgi:hypothetical protein
MNNQTTYTLLVRSEERSRDLLETAVYAMCTLSAIVAIWAICTAAVVIGSDQGNIEPAR